jgi:hypothetical protein
MSTADLLGSIHKDAQDWPDRRVYVIIHNIDGPGAYVPGGMARMQAAAAAAGVADIIGRKPLLGACNSHWQVHTGMLITGPLTVYCSLSTSS